MKNTRRPIEEFIKNLMPTYSSEERQEAEDNLLAYIELVERITLRLEQKELDDS